MADGGQPGRLAALAVREQVGKGGERRGGLREGRRQLARCVGRPGNPHRVRIGLLHPRRRGLRRAAEEEGRSLRPGQVHQPDRARAAAAARRRLAQGGGRRRGSGVARRRGGRRRGRRHLLARHLFAWCRDGSHGYHQLECVSFRAQADDSYTERVRRRSVDSLVLAMRQCAMGYG